MDNFGAKLLLAIIISSYL